MEDIEQYLREKEAVAACFRISGRRCKMTIATGSQYHLKEIIEDWDDVEEEGSDIHYMFRNMAFLPREEQISAIQREIRYEGATPLIKSEEQKVASICRQNGASQVHYKNHGDRLEFFITGHLDNEVMEELKQVEKSREHIYLNPPRCKWTYTNQGEVEPMGNISPLRASSVVNDGEQLL
jgi:hypothetical protein